MENADWRDLRKIRSVANYQFGPGVGNALFPNRGVFVARSKRTGRIRHIYFESKLIATLRPTDGYLALTCHSAKMLLKRLPTPPNLVRVRSDVSEFVAVGGNVFAKHVVSASPTIRPTEEVIVTDESGGLLAVGRAILTGEEMVAFRRGVAIKTRQGVKES